MRRLVTHQPDRQISAILNRQGRTHLQGAALHAQPGRGLAHYQAPDNPPPGDLVTVAEAARELGIAGSTTHRWINDGFIAGEQLTPEAPWQIRMNDELRSWLVDQAPPGYIPMQDATRWPGVSSQTVLQGVQIGKLEAVHVYRERRKGLRTRLSDDNPGPSWGDCMRPGGGTKVTPPPSDIQPRPGRSRRTGIGGESRHSACARRGLRSNSRPDTAGPPLRWSRRACGAESGPSARCVRLRVAAGAAAPSDGAGGGPVGTAAGRAPEVLAGVVDADDPDVVGEAERAQGPHPCCAVSDHDLALGAVQAEPPGLVVDALAKRGGIVDRAGVAGRALVAHGPSVVSEPGLREDAARRHFARARRGAVPPASIACPRCPGRSRAERSRADSAGSNSRAVLAPRGPAG